MAMTEPTDQTEFRHGSHKVLHAQDTERTQRLQGVPSNAVYARVGDHVLRAARDGVRRNRTPQDIVREIREEHGVHLSLGELHLLLASRRLPMSQGKAP